MDDSCRELADDIVMLARGELMNAKERNFLEQHIATCGDCRAAYKEQTCLSTAIAKMQCSIVDVPPLPLGLQLRAEFELSQARRKRQHKRIFSTIRVAAGCAVLCAAGYWTDQGRHHPASAAIQAHGRSSADPDDFVPIPSAPALGDHEHVDVYRVRLPQSALPSFGVASVPMQAGRVLTADIVVGDDGIARGIRIVR